MTSIDNLAEEIMQGLQEYADLADTAMKKSVRKSATQVKNEISANAPKDTGKYAKKSSALAGNCFAGECGRSVPSVFN